MDDWLLIAIGIGGAIAFYWLGYYDGKYKGYWKGREDGSESAINTFAEAMTGYGNQEGG